MNALVSLDNILEPAVALSPAHLFGTGQVEAILGAIEKDVRAEAYDITSPEGRERIKSVAYKIARSKTTLDEIGKEHVADIKAKSAAIDKERRTLRDRLDALKDEIRAPLTAWEHAETDRIDGHERAIVFLVDSTKFATPPNVGEIRTRILQVQDYEARDFQEFSERADAARTEAMATLQTMIEGAKKAEKDAAELEALRKEKAERDAREAEERRISEVREAEERRKAETAERERQHAERLEAVKREAEERAKRQAEEAAARAVEQERQRVADEEARKAAAKAEEEAAERKRQENTRHRNKIRAEVCNALTMETGFSEDQILLIFSAIATGKIPHISINY